MLMCPILFTLSNARWFYLWGEIDVNEFVCICLRDSTTNYRHDSFVLIFSIHRSRWLIQIVWHWLDLSSMNNAVILKPQEISLNFWMPLWRQSKLCLLLSGKLVLLNCKLSKVVIIREVQISLPLRLTNQMCLIYPINRSDVFKLPN